MKGFLGENALTSPEGGHFEICSHQFPVKNYVFKKLFLSNKIISNQNIIKYEYDKIWTFYENYFKGQKLCFRYPNLIVFRSKVETGGVDNFYF